MTTSGAEWPRMAGLGRPLAAKRPVRGPRTAAPMKPERPPTKCTGPQPAKSMTPMSSSGVGLPAEAQPCADQILHGHARDEARQSRSGRATARTDVLLREATGAPACQGKKTLELRGVYQDRPRARARHGGAPVHDDGIHKSREQRGVARVRLELAALRDGARHDRRRRRRKAHWKNHAAQSPAARVSTRAKSPVPMKALPVPSAFVP